MWAEIKTNPQYKMICRALDASLFLAAPNLPSSQYERRFERPYPFN
jgi:hypothetical protein